MVRALSSYGPQGVEVPCIQVSRLVVLGFWAPPKGIPLTPHYLGLEIALDITVMDENDPLLDCPRCPRSPLCSAQVSALCGALWRVEKSVHFTSVCKVCTTCAHLYYLLNNVCILNIRDLHG